MSFEEFQVGRHGGHLGYLNGTILAILNGSIQLTVWEEMSFEEFQDGRHGFRNETILAILKLYVATMPPIKFQLNMTYGFGRDIV